ncbi:MAG: acetyl-CoA synthetase, partial [Pseudoalteromonas distincta]
MSNFIVKSQAHYQELYKASVENPEKFWGDFAEQEFVWHKKWDKVLDYDLYKPEIKWFEGAKLNI